MTFRNRLWWFRPNVGTSIRNDLGIDNYVLVNVNGAKDKNQAVATAAKSILDYVQANPHADECVGKIENLGAYSK
ncbi:phage tail termination protein [Enterobacter sp. A4]|uniref:phage tail termination protein n=1 Tax=Enterobacter TaxID=547 RepID=UPI003D2134C5